jgi:hypothetical protein
MANATDSTSTPSGPVSPGQKPGSAVDSTATITGTGDGSIMRVASIAGLQLAGIWLMCLIAVSLFTAVVIFGATQFQIRISNLSLYGGPLTVWKAEELLQSWSASLEVLDAAKQAYNKNQRTLAQSLTDASQAYATANLAFANADSAYQRLIEKARRADPELASKMSDRLSSSGLSIIEADLQNLKAKDPTIESQLAIALDLDAKARTANGIAQARSNEFDQLSKTVDQDKKNLEDKQKKAHLDIPDRDGQSVPNDQKTQIENAIYEFHAMRNYLFGSVYAFALAPSDILVLVLVCAMGLLGSSLQLSYVYLTEFDTRRITFYIFRPFLGVIMAFAVFIIAKAGIPVLTDASRFGGNAPINPYLISFLAILSGLMSERALVGLRQLGATYFREGESDEAPHWARKGVDEQLSKANRNPAGLAPYLNAEEPEIKAWIEGKKPVPPSAQVVIAAILNVARRELFTDIAPRDANNPHQA